MRTIWIIKRERKRKKESVCVRERGECCMFHSFCSTEQRNGHGWPTSIGLLLKINRMCRSISLIIAKCSLYDFYSGLIGWQLSLFCYSTPDITNCKKFLHGKNIYTKIEKNIQRKGVEKGKEISDVMVERWDIVLHKK